MFYVMCRFVIVWNPKVSVFTYVCTILIVQLNIVNFVAQVYKVSLNHCFQIVDHTSSLLMKSCTWGYTTSTFYVVLVIVTISRSVPFYIYLRLCLNNRLPAFKSSYTILLTHTVCPLTRGSVESPTNEITAFVLLQLYLDRFRRYLSKQLFLYYSASMIECIRYVKIYKYATIKRTPIRKYIIYCVPVVLLKLSQIGPRVNVSKLDSYQAAVIVIFIQNCLL